MPALLLKFWWAPVILILAVTVWIEHGLYVHERDAVVTKQTLIEQVQADAKKAALNNAALEKSQQGKIDALSSQLTEQLNASAAAGISLSQRVYQYEALRRSCAVPHAPGSAGADNGRVPGGDSAGSDQRIAGAFARLVPACQAVIITLHACQASLKVERGP